MVSGQEQEEEMIKVNQTFVTVEFQPRKSCRWDPENIWFRFLHIFTM